MEKNIPNHIAIIMDGNGRWAKKRGLARSFGHMEGAKTLRKALEYLTEIGVKYLTVYAFSTENWNRPQDEVSTLMKLFLKYIKSERKNMMKNKIRFFVSGRKNNVPEKLQKEIEKLEEETKNNDRITLNIAFNYGSRAEIVDAVNRIIKDGKENITEEDFSKYLYNDFPDPDLVIRTSGEMRISNFLLWQIAYSEFYITDTLWPDFDEKEIDYTYNDITLSMNMIKALNLDDLFKNLEKAHKVFVIYTGYIQKNLAEELKRNFLNIGLIVYTLDIKKDQDLLNKNIEKNDIVFAISFSGENKSLIDFIKKIKKEIILVSITKLSNNKISKMSDYNLSFQSHEVYRYEENTSIRPVSQYYVIIDFLVLKFLNYRSKNKIKISKSL